MIEIVYNDIDEIPGFTSEFLHNWFSKVVFLYSKNLFEITIVLCSDEYLLEMNRTHLNHDFYTDIITFDYCENNYISGDLFISTDRVLENSKEFKVSFIDELHRVSVHGLLHLCGLKDKSDEDEKAMRYAENQALNLI